MWRSIWRKARADLRGRPLQTLLMFLVIAAAAATLSLSTNLRASAQLPYERLRERSNGADAWVTFHSPGDLSQLRSLPQVQEVGEAYPVSWENQGIRNGSVKRQVALVGLGPTLPAFDHPVVTAGRWLAADGARELVLDAGAARLLDLRVGQQASLLRAEGPVEFTVVGFAVTASRAPDPLNDPAFAYVLPETLRELHPGVVFGGDQEHTLRVGVRLAPGVPLLSFFEALRASLRGEFNVRGADDIERNIEEANQFNLIFLRVFSVFALLAAGLIVANAVGGQVLSQSRDIGVLKSIGFTPWQVTGALLLQNIALAAVASVSGVALGLALAPVFLGQAADVLGVPASPRLSVPALLVPLAAVIGIVALFTLVPGMRAARVSPLAALDRGGVTRRTGVSRVSGALAGLRLPHAARVGVADLTRRPMRTALTLLALVLAVITATFTLGIEATFAKTMDDPTVIGGPPYDLGFDRDTVEDARARRIIADDPDVEAVLPVYGTAVRIERFGFGALVYEGELDNDRWPLRTGRMPAAPGEAAISTALASRIGARAGQTLTLQHGASDAVNVTVVGVYASTEGDVLATVPGTFPIIDPPTDYYARLRPGADPHATADRIVAASGGELDAEVFADTVADLRESWRPLLIGLNAVLFGIAGINLTSNLLLAVRERRRELAILKTVGFTPRQLTIATVSGGIAVAALATLFGIPLGLIATRIMFDVLSSAAGIGTGVGALPGANWLALLLPLALFTVAVASAFPAAVAARVRVAEALRHE
ncbi:MAG: ABC transporter permease [Dehalococcoidia bacterium]